MAEVFMHPRRSLLLILLLLGPGSAGRAAAAWPPDGVSLCGGEPGCDPNSPVPAPDGTGGAFVVWVDNRLRPASSYDIYLQRVTGTGEIPPGWPADGLPVCVDPAPQFHEIWSVVPDGTGGVIVGWQDGRNEVPGGTGYDIYAQRFLADGSLAPGWAVNGVPVTRLPGRQERPVAVADGAGGAYISWWDEGAYDVQVHRLGPDGQPAPGWPVDGLPLCTLPSRQGVPQVAADGLGGVIVAWDDLRDGPVGVYGQRVLPTGEIAPGWPENGVRIVTGRGIRELVPDGAGGAYLSCTTEGAIQDGAYYLQRLTGAGTLASGWPAGGAPVCTAPGDRGGLRMVPDGEGGVYLTWGDNRHFPIGSEIYVQRMRPDGTRSPGWPVDGLRVTDNRNFDDYPDLASDRSGGVYLCWDQCCFGYPADERVAVQHLTGSGAAAPGWPANGMVIPSPDGNQLPHITADGYGGALVAWQTSTFDVRALRFAPDGPTPVEVALVSAQASPEGVRLTWYRAGGGGMVAWVERRTEGSAWERLGAAEATGDGYLRFEDRGVTPGARYAYRLAYREGDAEFHTAESWVEVPIGLHLALRGFVPNPASGTPSVAFQLPSGEPAVLELLDLTGRRLLARDVGALGAGRHLARLGEGARLPPGIYWLRLRQGRESATTRGLIVR